MTERRALRGIASVAAAWAVALTGSASATAQASTPTIELVGGANARTVQLAPCLASQPNAEQGLDTPSCAPGPSGDLTGTLTFAVVNHGGERASIQIRWIQDGAAHPVGVLGGGPVTLVGAARRDLSARVEALAKKDVSLAAVLRLLARIGVHAHVPAAVESAMAKAVGHGFRSLSRDEVRSIVSGMQELLRPSSTELSLDRLSVKRLVKRIKLVVTATPDGRGGALKKLAQEVLKLVEARVSLRVKGRGKRVFTVRVDVPASTDPTRIKGRLELDVKNIDQPAEFNVPVEAKLRPLTGIVLEPSSIDIQRTSPWSTDEQQVDLYGPGVEALLAGEKKSEVSVRIRGRGGEFATVRLKLTRVAGDRATARVRLTDKPGPGKYAGTLPLTRLQSDPHFDLEVRSRLTRWVAFGLILFSAIVAGAGRELSALGRRRRLLERALKREWRRFRYVRETVGEPASYSLSDVNQAVYDDVIESIASARTNQDLDDDRDRVLGLIARMERWLRIEPVARRLRMLLGQRRDGALREYEWSRSWTLRYARTLRHAMHDEPKDVAAADDVVGRALWLTDWYHRFSRVWAGASDPNTSAADVDAVIALDKALADTPVFELTRAQRDALDARLDELEDREWARGLPHESLPDVSRGVKEPLPRVSWDLPAYRFLGWAGLNGPVFRQLERRADATARPFDNLVPSKEPRAPRERRGWRERLKAPWRGRKNLWRGLKRYKRSELFWTLVSVAAASVIYLNTIYDDTWGSLTDILTALVAGFGTALAIQWAALPIFQSIRLRASKAAGG